MSDVWRELEERLKQKAFERYELPEWVLRRHKWVRLEDVKKELQQLKQNYVFVSREKLEEIYKNLEIDKISGYYVNLEFFRMIEELLRKNEG